MYFLMEDTWQQVSFSLKKIDGWEKYFFIIVKMESSNKERMITMKKQRLERCVKRAAHYRRLMFKCCEIHFCSDSENKRWISYWSELFSSEVKRLQKLLIMEQ